MKAKTRPDKDTFLRLYCIFRLSYRDNINARRS